VIGRSPILLKLVVGLIVPVLIEAVPELLTVFLYNVYKTGKKLTKRLNEKP